MRPSLCIDAGGLRKFIGKIESRQHGDAQRVHGTSLRGDGAHLAVNLLREVPNVLGVLADQVIGLVVDVDGRVTGGAGGFSWP